MRAREGKGGEAGDGERRYAPVVAKARTFPPVEPCWEDPARAGMSRPRLPVYQRGQRQGVFRADCPFEIAHGVAMSALVGSAVLAPRGAEILGWTQRANFIVAGGLTLASAIGLRRALRPLGGSTWGPLLVGAYATGLLGAGSSSPTR